MSVDIRALLPNRISGQIALLIVISLAVIHVILTASFILNRPDRNPARPEGPPGQIIPLLDLINAAEPNVRARLVAEIGHAFPHFGLVLADPIASPARSVSKDSRFDRLRHHLAPQIEIAAIDAPSSTGGTGVVPVSFRLRDGQVVTARIPPDPPPPFRPEMITLLFIAISVTLLGLWAARALTAPLRAFAKAAEGFSPDGEVALLAERGPYEVKTAAKAFNRMRERIKHLVNDRIRMLAAMGHDLRTPITRLRLRSEFIEDAAVRTQMLRDLDQMQAMIESALSYLRDGQTREATTMIDLAAALQTVCDQFSDTGRDVAYVGPNHLGISAQPHAMHRAVTNLVDNAVRHGSKVVVRLSVEESNAVICVEDDGPGIADIDKDAMLEPFVRGDHARGMNETAGFGLGLSIARTIVAAHGGMMTLLDRQPTGLSVRIKLPLPHDPRPTPPRK